jgi:putative transposase
MMGSGYGGLLYNGSAHVAGLATYYVLFFIHLGNRRVSIAGITDHPDAVAMEQMARNATMEELGCLHPCRYLLHDRDTKFCDRSARC